MSQRGSVFVIVLGVGLGAAVAFQPAAAQSNDARAVVRLAPDASGQCNAVEKTDTVRVSKSRQPFVTFAVANQCATDVVFSVDGFRHPSQGRAVDPIQQAAGQRRTRVRAGATGSLRLRVKPDAPEGEWTYDIRLDDRLVDPKLQIDP